MTYENASLSAGKYIENHGVIHNMGEEVLLQVPVCE